MSLTKTPVCNFGEKAKNFNLLSIENKKISLNDISGNNGTLICLSVITVLTLKQ